MGVTQQGFTQFLGLRTDTTASKLSPEYSPDCSDLTFSVGGMATRNPFVVQQALPNGAVWRKEFTAKNGTTQILALDATGALYVYDHGFPTKIDQVAAGSSVSSVTAYGREYMSFFGQDGQGIDAPRQWDGRKLYRVSQGGPGAAPTVSNVSLPVSGIFTASRVSNEVTLVTYQPHSLQKGYQATIAGLDAAIQNITSIVIDNDILPGVATITTPAPHGLVPGNSISISGVQSIVPGVSFVSWARVATVVTITMSAPHDLTPGTSISVELNSDGFGPAIVDTVPSPTTFTFTNNGGDGSGLTGAVFLPWPFDSGQLFNIQATPTPTTFICPLNFVSSTWNTGFLSFDWDGIFYVESVLSTTSFTYRQLGPDSSIESVTGTVTPTGQMAAGDHLICQHFITDTGFITSPSPSVRFTASGGQYVKVDDLAIGPANVTGRILSFTGANGSAFAILLVPAQVNGQQISTSTVVNDNTSTSVVIDFSDTTLLSAAATRIDVPGNNLFQQVALNLPNGVNWYFDRLFWKGEKNTVIGFLNMDMAGGHLFGSVVPLGWGDFTGVLTVSQLGIMPVLQGTGSMSQPADTTLRGDAIIQQNLNYSFRAWLNGGTVTANLSSASTSFTSVATITGNGYVTGSFSQTMPATIPDDLTLTVTLAGATVRDMQLIFADNPNRNPIARGAYLKNPEAYDALTGNVGPNDDPSELRAIFVLQESLFFITAKRLYSVQQIGNSEPSSWDPLQVSDKCGTFNANSVVTGKGWAAWGGELGAFWFAGAIPQKVSAIINPTWRNIASVSTVFDDPDLERVYFGVTGNNGVKSMLVYSYHEVDLGGPGKWCPWNRPLNWISDSSTGPLFLFGDSFYSLSANAGTDDSDMGPIGGYYTFPPVGSSMLRKLYDYMALQISGTGTMTPFLYAKDLSTLTKTLRAQDLAALQDIVAEWPINTTGRLLFLKLGQPGVQFSLDNAAVMYSPDPNAPISGVR